MESLADRYAVPRRCRAVDEMLDLSELDAVYVAARMNEAARACGVKLMIGNMMRFNPCHEWTRRPALAGP